MLRAPEEMLAERARLGTDVHDEVWEGVLHMVPPPSSGHQRTGGRLYRALSVRAEHLGLEPYFETGLFRDERDYRVPDQLYCRPEDVSERGAERAELVVEVRSPDDESYAKLAFYAALRVREVLVVHPGEARAELFRLAGDQMFLVGSDADGAVRSDVLGVRFGPVGGRLGLTWDGGSAEV